MTTISAPPDGDARLAEAPSRLTAGDRIALLRLMLLQRTLEERALNLYRQGKVPGSFYDGRGEEAVGVGAAFALAPEDRLCPLHRDLGAHLVRGVSAERILAQYLGRATGVTGGRDGNVHFGDHRVGCVGMVSMLPDMMLVATGMAMAFRMRGERRVALTWCGDGSTSRGDWHEAMNWSAVQRLPVIFVLQNNRFAYSTPVERQYAVDPVRRAAGYGMPGVSVDGNDAEAVFAATLEARERAVAGGGPTLIAADTMRMHGHAAHDDMRYVAPELVGHWSERDPIALQAGRAAGAGADLEALRAEIAAEVDAATKAALAAPMPDPATACDGVFADHEVALGDGAAPWSGWARAPR